MRIQLTLKTRLLTTVSILILVVTGCLCTIQMVRQVRVSRQLDTGIAVLTETFIAEQDTAISQIRTELVSSSKEILENKARNTAVNQIDRVTQQNATHAQQSASASEELRVQADQMNGIVQELVGLVGSSKERTR